MSLRLISPLHTLKSICFNRSIPTLRLAPVVVRRENFSSLPRLFLEKKNDQENLLGKNILNESKKISSFAIDGATTKRKLSDEVTKSEVNPVFKDNIYTIPNLLTATRIITAPFIGYFIVNHNSVMAISIFIYSCITDFVDGFIARKFNQKSVLGSILDPIADKFLMTICTISMAYIHSIPTYLATLIIGRDIILSLMSLYYRYSTLPVPKTFKRYINISIPTVSLHPNMLSKVNTAFQMIYLGSLVLKPGIESILPSVEYITNFNLFLSGFEILVACTTLSSGLTYIFSKKAFKLIQPKS